jgi:signal transduction histidine kinase
LAEEKGIALIHRESVERTLVECDRQRLMQVFANLIGNALKVCRSRDTVTLGCEHAGRAVRFYVEDTGPGIEPESLGRVFDPYWSGSSTRTGVGLGLYISRGIVERHGGGIDVESIVGRGTRFSFDIPLATTTGAQEVRS